MVAFYVCPPIAARKSRCASGAIISALSSNWNRTPMCLHGNDGSSPSNATVSLSQGSSDDSAHRWARSRTSMDTNNGGDDERAVVAYAAPDAASSSNWTRTGVCLHINEGSNPSDATDGCGTCSGAPSQRPGRLSAGGYGLLRSDT